jgi:hypothetical protein
MKSLAIQNNSEHSIFCRSGRPRSNNSPRDEKRRHGRQLWNIYLACAFLRCGCHPTLETMLRIPQGAALAGHPGVQPPRAGMEASRATSEHEMNIETPQPGMAERAIDTATNVSRTITEVSAALQAAVDQLSRAIATARQPGKPLSTISAITRQAPLASLLVAFLFGIAVARRR